MNNLYTLTHRHTHLSTPHWSAGSSNHRNSLRSGRQKFWPKWNDSCATHTQELRRVGRRADKRKSLAAVRLYRQLYIHVVYYIFIPIEVRALPHRQQHPPCRRWQLAMNFVAQTFLPCCRQNMPEVLKIFHLILGIYILYITVYMLCILWWHCTERARRPLNSL